MLKVTVFDRMNMMVKVIMFSITVTLAASMRLASKVNSPNVPLQDVPHHNDVPGKLTDCSSITFSPFVVQYTQPHHLIILLSSKVA
jgi:hypothetical protein